MSVSGRINKTKAIGADDRNGRKNASLKAPKKFGKESEKRVKKTYADLKKEFRKTRKLWEDPDFPADSSSVFVSERSQGYRSFDWKRPKEITPEAEFFVDGVSQSDVQQGEIGDCWLLAAAGSLCRYKSLFKKVVPFDQDFGKHYIGAFRFHFWRFGKWQEVVVDDRIPTRNGKLVYLCSTNPNEYWSVLLEKAYAKVRGSYESLISGIQSEAMEDFTGGLCEIIKLEPDKLLDNMFKLLLTYMSRSTLMGCAISSSEQIKLDNGLITQHAYSITDVKKMKLKRGGMEDLIKVWNPWGNEHKWKGSWCDTSQEWNNVSKKTRKKLCNTLQKNGESWISYQDFLANFTKLEICHLGPESLDRDFKGKRKWQMSIVEGEWSKNRSAGGTIMCKDTFGMNPQYKFQVMNSNKNDESNLGTVIIGLMQKDVYKERKEYFQIGYIIYDIPSSECGTLSMSYFQSKYSVAVTAFTNYREVCERHKLPPGHYVVIPSTRLPNEEAEFILRIFTQKPNKIKALDAKHKHTKTCKQPEEEMKIPQERQKRLEDAKRREEEKKKKNMAEHMNLLEEKQRRKATDSKKKKKEQDLELNKNKSNSKLCFTFHK